jgi:hypothetical protein
LRLHDRLHALGWLAIDSTGASGSYDLTPKGAKALQGLGVDVEGSRMLRRRFAFACLDWSERRSHLGGALGAAVLKSALRSKWIALDLDSRALRVTSIGRREMLSTFGIQV